MTARSTMRRPKDVSGDGRTGSRWFAEGSVSDGLRILIGRIGAFAIWAAVLPYAILPAMVALTILFAVSDWIIVSGSHRGFGLTEGFVVATIVLGVGCLKGASYAVVAAIVGIVLRLWSKFAARGRTST